MRPMRILILAAIALIVAAVGLTYHFRRSLEAGSRAARIEQLPPGVDASLKEWAYTFYQGNRPTVEVRARRLTRLQNPERLELEGVQLKIFDETGDRYDRVESSRAQFDAAQGILYSDGEVEIQLAAPREELAGGHLVAIRSSGVSFDGKTGGAHTERDAWFRFENGEGRSRGATYDPAARELHLHQDVAIQWLGGGASPTGMTIEAGAAIYKEQESRVYLHHWSRLHKKDTSLTGGDAVVALSQGRIREIEARQAAGVSLAPQREIRYAADELKAEISPTGELTRLLATGHAQLETRSPAGKNQVNAARLTLEFAPSGSPGDSLLREALAMGGTRIDIHPAPPKNAPPSPSRRLESDAVRLFLRDDGRSLDRVETLTPGALELLPRAPGDPYRRLEAERMFIQFGRDNQLESYRAAKATTLTRFPPRAQPKGKPLEPPPQRTASNDLLARFDESSGELTQLEQWNDFRYEEGPRRATGGRGVLNQAAQTLTLEGEARVWDDTGALSAHRILLHQESGDLTAEGKVNSSRRDTGGKTSPSLLAARQPLQARAERLITKNNNTWIRYEGDVLLWQATDRLSAQEVEIDRKAGVLRASGGVLTLLRERSSPTSARLTAASLPASPAAPAGAAGAPPSPAGQVVTVSAQRLVYNETDSLADYQGSVVLRRGSVEVRADRLRAFFEKNEDGESLLRKALADGNAIIRRAEPRRTRTGSAEHAEYYLPEEKIVLYGGAPLLQDSLRGATRGERLTYYTTDDRLLVGGREDAPAVTKILRQ